MKPVRFYFFLIFFLLFAESTLAQEQNSVQVSASYQQQPLEQVILDLEKRYPVQFYFKEEWLKNRIVTTAFQNLPISEALTKILQTTGISYVQYNPYAIVLLPANTFQQPISETVLKDFAASEVIVIGDSLQQVGNRPVTLSGYLKDQKTGEPIIGGRISVDDLKTGTVTDQKGFYSISMPAGQHYITFSTVGLSLYRKIFLIYSDGVYSVDLSAKTITLSEVEVQGKRADANISEVQAGVTQLDIKQIRKLPAMLGEVDVLKTIQLLPGVTSVGEGAAGFNVRGGSADQNLILFDDAPVFNSSHVFGFFSVFNPDVVKDITLYRGGIPARQGGRISSVLDVRQRNGNLSKYTGTGGIGPITARLALEGPIVKEKTSFLIGGRASYSDWIMKKLPDAYLRDNSVKFYDGSLRLSHHFSEKSRLYWSGYYSHDSFGFSEDTVYAWQTRNTSLKFEHSFSDKFFGTVTATAGDYNFNVTNDAPASGSEYRNGIMHKSLKADLSYFAGIHQLEFGVAATHFTISPGELKPTTHTELNYQLVPEERGLESAVYVHDEIEVTPRLTLMFGLRYSAFQALGPGEEYTYVAGQPLKPRTITDTIAYAENDVIKTYYGLEPRFMAKYSLSESSSVKFGYNRMRQNLHLITNTIAISPLDVWKMSDQHIKPQIGDQVSLGYFRNLQNNSIETSVEVYYKKIQNMLDYKNGAQLLLNKTLETEVLAGEGSAYGVEFLLSKKTGRFTGWATYTFNRTWLQVNGNSDEEKINDGAKYPANYDKPHNVVLVGNYQINRRLAFSGNFTYSTGRPATAALGQYIIDGNVVPYFGYRNQARIPDYHRLDLALTVQTNHKKNKAWEGNWSFAIYNVYGRKNAYSVFYRHNYGTQPQAFKLSVIGVMLPSVTYNFKF